MTMASPSPKETAMGFSQSTALGRRAQAAMDISACWGSQEQTLTMSRFSTSSISR